MMMRSVYGIIWQAIRDPHTTIAFIAILVCIIIEKNILEKMGIYWEIAPSGIQGGWLPPTRN
jgi:hypothetical protein